MSAWQRFWRRLRGSFAGARADREFQEELRAHLEMQVADNLRAGLSPGEALRQARLALGGFETARARQREQRGLPILDSLGAIFGSPCARSCAAPASLSSHSPCWLSAPAPTP